MEFELLIFGNYQIAIIFRLNPQTSNTTNVLKAIVVELCVCNKKILVAKVKWGRRGGGGGGR